LKFLCYLFGNIFSGICNKNSIYKTIKVQRPGESARPGFVYRSSLNIIQFYNDKYLTTRIKFRCSVCYIQIEYLQDFVVNNKAFSHEEI